MGRDSKNHTPTLDIEPFFFAYKKEKIVKEITFLNTQIVKKVKISLSKWISYSILKVLIGNTWM